MSDKIKVNAVHYHSATLEQAKQHFEDVGFTGITGLTKSAPINCNQARTEVRHTEEVTKGSDTPERWYYQGDHDYSYPSDCAIYTFYCDVEPSSRG